MPEDEEEARKDMEEETEEELSMKVEPGGFGMEEAETEFQHAQAAKVVAQFEAEQEPSST